MRKSENTTMRKSENTTDEMQIDDSFTCRVALRKSEKAKTRRNFAHSCFRILEAEKRKHDLAYISHHTVQMDQKSIYKPKQHCSEIRNDFLSLSHTSQYHLTT
jgi:hypothetical protein